MAKIEVTISEMKSAATKLEKAASDFLSMANRVLSTAESLGSSWEGDSNDAFQAEQAAANEWYRQMIDLVNNYIDNLRSAADIYQSTDAESAQEIRNC